MKKIILLCAAGMSTSMLVKKMQEAAASESFECEIAAYPTAEAKDLAPRCVLPRPKCSLPARAFPWKPST